MATQDPLDGSVEPARAALIRGWAERNEADHQPPFKGIKFNSPEEVAWAIHWKHWSGDVEAMAPIDFSGAVLSGLDLGGFSFNGADFSGADLNEVNLSRAAVNGADFTKAGLIGANFSAAQCEWSIFSSANMIRCDMSQANAAGARLNDAILLEAVLYGTHFERADLSYAKLASAHLNGAKLMNANLTQAFVSQATFDEALLGGAILDNVIADGARFVGAFLANVHAVEASLKGADLTKANLSGATLLRADLALALLLETKLSDADLRAADLREARFDSSSQLAGVKLDKFAKIGDVVWNGVPLIRVGWEEIPVIGDEIAVSNVKLSLKGLDREVYRTKLASAYRDAARAYHGLAVALQEQGLSDEASRYRVREFSMRRRALWASGNFGNRMRWAFEHLLFVVSGRGEIAIRALYTYVAVILGFAGIYQWLYWIGATSETKQVWTWDSPLLLSITSFHGRVFFAGSLPITDWVARIGAIEAALGFLIEVIFIATFSRRFLGD